MVTLLKPLLCSASWTAERTEVAVLHESENLEIGLGLYDMGNLLCVLVRKAAMDFDGRVDAREQCGVQILEVKVGIGHQWNAVIYLGAQSITRALYTLTFSMGPFPGVPL